jgi:hypothetical protein
MALTTLPCDSALACDYASSAIRDIIAARDDKQNATVAESFRHNSSVTNRDANFQMDLMTPASQ